MTTVKLSFWKQDPQGYFVNDSSWDKVSKDYYPLIEEIKQIYLTYFGDSIHSIYLYGSVGKGTEKRGVSDVDTLAVVKEGISIDDGMFDKLNNEGKQLAKKYPIASHVQMEAFPYSQITRIDEFSFEGCVLKMQGVCIHGTSLIDTLSPIKPTIGIANSELVQLKNDITQGKEEIAKATSGQQVWYWCKRIMKNIIRDGFFLVMEKEQKFSTEIHTNVEVFVKYYPAKEKEMRYVLFLAENPSEDKERVVKVLDTFGQWIVEETDKWLDTYNPSRESQI